MWAAAHPHMHGGETRMFQLKGRMVVNVLSACSIFLAVAGGRVAIANAAAEPAPDPSGVATGDRGNVVDAGGNALVVAAPDDTAAADYAEKKKAFDEYQGQVEKEPLAAKLADAVGHLRLATNFSWTLSTGYL